MVDTFKPHYLFQKRDVYYYSRHVPNDVRDHYTTNRIVFSLRTKSRKLALRASSSISQRLEDYWMSLRLAILDIPGAHFVREHSNSGLETRSPMLSEALETYLRLKGAKRNKTFHRGARRNIEAVIEALGDRVIDDYNTSDAAKFRDLLLDKGLNTSTIRRNFSTIKAIMNLSFSENGLNCANPFSGIYIPDLDDVNKRKPIPFESIRSIQIECRTIDDDKRWLLALISDTGMRLSEAVGLHVDDIKLDHMIPHIKLKPHPWRSLKTNSSQRDIPLVGSALWAAIRLQQNNKGSPFLFPRYTTSRSSNGNSASAALNKWLKPRVPEKCVIHSFRHSFRDRLRAVQCPVDLIDELGGWVTRGVGSQYGDGYPLDIKGEMMKLIILKST